MKRTILITGANKGIGLETARQLGKEGHTILLCSRNKKLGEVALKNLSSEGVQAQLIELDVVNPEQIQEAVKYVGEKFGKLDTLINNAAVSLEAFNGSPTSQTTMETWRKTFEVNLFAVISVTNAFLPLLRKSEAGRIVNLSSILGSLTTHSDPKSPIHNSKSSAYDVSKSALNAYTVHMAYELKDTTIKVNVAHPGWVKTDMGGEEAPMELVDGAKTSVWLATLDSNGPTGGYFHLQERLPW